MRWTFSNFDCLNVALQAACDVCGPSLSHCSNMVSVDPWMRHTRLLDFFSVSGTGTEIACVLNPILTRTYWKRVERYPIPITQRWAIINLSTPIRSPYVILITMRPITRIHWSLALIEIDTIYRIPVAKKCRRNNVLGLVQISFRSRR